MSRFNDFLWHSKQMRTSPGFENTLPIRYFLAILVDIFSDMERFNGKDL